MFIINIAKCFLKKIDKAFEKYPNKMTKFKVLCGGSPQLIWHFPPLNIVRSVSFCFLFGTWLHRFTKVYNVLGMQQNNYISVKNALNTPKLVFGKKSRTLFP
jgi:hypothetical protein